MGGDKYKKTLNIFLLDDDSESDGEYNWKNPEDFFSEESWGLLEKLFVWKASNDPERFPVLLQKKEYATQPDVVIVDLQWMGVGGNTDPAYGVRIATEILNQTYDLPILFWTGEEKEKRTLPVATRWGQYWNLPIYVRRSGLDSVKELVALIHESHARWMLRWEQEFFELVRIARQAYKSTWSGEGDREDLFRLLFRGISFQDRSAFGKAVHAIRDIATGADWNVGEEDWKWIARAKRYLFDLGCLYDVYLTMWMQRNRKPEKREVLKAFFGVEDEQSAYKAFAGFRRDIEGFIKKQEKRQLS